MPTRLHLRRTTSTMNSPALEHLIAVVLLPIITGGMLMEREIPIDIRVNAVDYIF